MPFAIFRRHQKKLIVIFAILAMVGFVLSDTLYRLGGGGGRNGNPVIVDLYGKPVHRDQLNGMANKRARSNRFLLPITRSPDLFGGLSTRELVDALILEHQANLLGIPGDAEMAKAWLQKQFNGKFNQAEFDTLLSMMGGDVDGETILTDLASQIRLNEVAKLSGNPLVTPLDFFQTYREQNERSNFKVISFPAANYTDKVGEPTDEQLRALLDKGKDTLPDPTRDAPAFKVPRQVKLEILSVDVNALAKEIEAKLNDKSKESEAELRAYYDNHKADLTPPRELPTDLFANDKDAKLTPAIFRTYAEVIDTIRVGLAKSKAQDEVTGKFDKLRDEYLNKFADKYHDTQADIEEAQKNKEATKHVLPSYVDLSAIAKENKLNWEVTPPLSRLDADNYGVIASANSGAASTPDDPKFAEVVFDDKNQLFDSMEFSDLAGRRFLVRKIADTAPRVPTFDEVRPKLITAWKLDKARDLARTAAGEALTKIKTDGGIIKDQVVLGRPVVTIDGATRRLVGMPVPGGFMQIGDSTPAELSQIPYAGEKLRATLFGLNPGEVAVEANAPNDTYYVLTLAKRDPATFASLYGPTSSPFAYMNETIRGALRTHGQRWMQYLRDKAGLPENWSPPGETDRPTRRS